MWGQLGLKAGYVETIEVDPFYSRPCDLHDGAALRRLSNREILRLLRVVPGACDTGRQGRVICGVSGIVGLTKYSKRRNHSPCRRCPNAESNLRTPNVRVKPVPTVGRQARTGENVPRTASPGLVACRWGSA